MKRGGPGERDGTGPLEETRDYSAEIARASRQWGRRRGDLDAELPELPPRYREPVAVGAGGQGAVYRVFDTELERSVALKTVHAERFSPGERAFFLREARAAAGLEHPNVVPIHDLGELPDGRPYYTMRLVEGRTLGDLLESVASGASEELSLVRLVQMMQQLCRGLQAAHERGVIHRDIKPANVLVGELDEVLVVDWGIAKSSAAGMPRRPPAS